jgi:hypothetical protein
MVIGPGAFVLTSAGASGFFVTFLSFMGICA